MLRSKHHAVNGDHRIEGSIRKGKLFRVAFDKLHGEVLGLGAKPSAFQQRGDKITPDHLTAPPRRGDSSIAAPGGNVQYAPAGLQVGRLAELFGLIDNTGGYHRKIAAG